MRIHLTTSTLRAIFQLQRDGVDDNKIINAVKIKQRVSAARRALIHAESQESNFMHNNDISGPDQLAINQIAGV